jgi:neutral ceramidase
MRPELAVENQGTAGGLCTWMPLLAWWLLVALLVPTARAAGLRAGAATANITPPLGIEINGGTRPITATHVHDELHARALVLDDGAGRLAFVVVDNCLIDRTLFDETKALIYRHVGLVSNHVSISTTHTHSAGSVTGVHLSEPDPPYRAWLPGRITDAVRLAVNQLAPAQIAWGRGAVPEHVFNRRVTVQPGLIYTNLLGRTGDRVKMNWSSPEPAVDDEFSGPVDPELFILSVRHTDGRPLALLANYSLHYVGGVGPGHLSAEYYGVFCERMAELLGAEKQDPPFVTLMSNGTSGDVNNNDFRQSRASQPPYEQIRRVAEDVAREAQRVEKTSHYQTAVRLGAASTELKVAVRKPSPAEVERARALINGRDRLALRTWPEFYAREQLILADWPDEVSLPIQVFRLGELVVAQWPGEIFAVSGLDLKKRSPLQPLFNISLANGWYGYIPPPEQHALGAYETWRGRTSPLVTNAVPQISACFLKLLAEWKESP